MTNLNTVLATQRALESMLMNKMTDFEAQLNSAPSSSNLGLPRLQQEFHDFKTEVVTILNLLRKQISEYVYNVDLMENRHRRKYVLFTGIPEDSISDGKLSDVIVNLCTEKFGLQDFNCDQISVCHRLGKPTSGKCRPVLVSFADMSMKSLVWKKKGNLKGTSIIMTEFLTRRRHVLFLEVRKHFGTSKSWTMHGSIYVKLGDGSRKRIESAEELAELVETQKGRLYDTEQNTGTFTEYNAKGKRTARFKK